jgi:nuclear receptor
LSFSATKGQCTIDKSRRNWCPYCRLQKCLQVNMNIAAVQQKRGPRAGKAKSSGKFGKWQIFPHTVSTDDEILMQILASCIQQARLNEQFRKFGADQRERILKLVWPEYFMLKLAYWSIDISGVVDK